MSVGVRPLARPQLTDDVAEYVRDLIVTGQVRAGEYLRLDRLAGRLGVSVTPVREALLTLRSEGFVEQVPRRGFRVLPFTRQDILDVYAVQSHLAGELAHRACLRLATDETAASLRELQDRLVQAHHDAEAELVEQLNHEFHRAVNVAADSPKLAQFLRTATRYSPRHFFARIDGWTQASADDHEVILSAFDDHDAEAAREAMATHVTKAGQLLFDHLSAQGIWTGAWR